jgi:hypothetical protein
LNPRTRVLEAIAYGNFVRKTETSVASAAVPSIFLHETENGVTEAMIIKKPYLSVNVKVKVTLQQVMKAQRGSRGIALLFL